MMDFDKKQEEALKNSTASARAPLHIDYLLGGESDTTQEAAADKTASKKAADNTASKKASAALVEVQEGLRREFVEAQGRATRGEYLPARVMRGSLNLRH